MTPLTVTHSKWRIDVRSAQAINKHINRLMSWREARANKSLDVTELENAIALAQEYLQMKGYIRQEKNIVRKDPALSIGLLEQIQHALLSGQYTDTALKNIATVIEEQKRINDAAGITRGLVKRCEARHVYKNGDQCTNMSFPGAEGCTEHKCMVHGCPNLWGVLLPMMGLRYCKDHRYLAPQ